MLRGQIRGACQRSGAVCLLQLRPTGPHTSAADHWASSRPLRQSSRYQHRPFAGRYCRRRNAGFVASALVIWLGARRGWPETVNTGIVFFVIFLYTKFYQWWWEIMPKYLFFLVVGLTAVLILLILKRLRQTFHLPAGEGGP